MLVASLIATSALVTARAPAAEQTKQQCIADHEEGQDLRRAGKLSLAIARFEHCSAASCPTIVREDCARRLEDARNSKPTVLFVAKNARNELIQDLRIRVDGGFPRPSDGSSIVVDPGTHRFELLADGYNPVTKSLTLTEGMRSREEVVLAPQARASEDGARMEGGGPNRTVPYAVGGVGVALVVAGGIVFWQAKEKHNEASARCGSPPNMCAAGTNELMEDARSLADVTTGLVIAGAAMIAAAAVIWLVTPTSQRTARLTGPSIGTW